MLLRRSCWCDGVAGATELRSTSSVALILRVASERRDAQNDETSIYPRVIKGRGPHLGRPMAP